MLSKCMIMTIYQLQLANPCWFGTPRHFVTNLIKTFLVHTETPHNLALIHSKQVSAIVERVAPSSKQTYTKPFLSSKTLAFHPKQIDPLKAVWHDKMDFLIDNIVEHTGSNTHVTWTMWASLYTHTDQLHTYLHLIGMEKVTLSQ